MRAKLSTPHGRFAVAAAALLALVVGSGLVLTTRYACGCAPQAPKAAGSSQAPGATPVETRGGSQPTDFSVSTIMTGPGTSGNCCGFGTFQSQSPRGVVSGGDIFLGLMSSWSSSDNPDVQSVYMSSNNGASWTDLVNVGGNSSRPPSLIVDSHGDVYAFIDSYDRGCSGTCPAGSFTAAGSRMYMFPAGNFSNFSYLTLGKNPHCGCTAGYDKASAGYDPGVGGIYGRAYFIEGDNEANPVFAVNLNSAKSASGDSIATAYTTASTEQRRQW